MRLSDMDAAIIADTMRAAALDGELTGEAIDWPEELADLGALELADLLWHCERAARIWRDCAGHAKLLLLDRLGDGGTIHDGQWAYRSVRTRQRFVDDPVELLHFLGDDAPAVLKLTAPDAVRVTQLRKVAEARGLEARLVEDTFLRSEWEEEPSLVRVRLDDEARCPRFVRDAAPGVLLGRKGGQDG